MFCRSPSTVKPASLHDDAIDAAAKPRHAAAERARANTRQSLAAFDFTVTTPERVAAAHPAWMPGASDDKASRALQAAGPVNAADVSAEQGPEDVCTTQGQHSPEQPDHSKSAQEHKRPAVAMPTRPRADRCSAAKCMHHAIKSFACCIPA